MMRVEVKPELLRWARERAGFDIGALARRFPNLDAWERGALHPTLKQVERFAKATYAPVGYLFLQEPPIERIPIPDFRTIRAESLKSANMSKTDGATNARRKSLEAIMLRYCRKRRPGWSQDRAQLHFSISGNTVSLFAKKPWAGDKSFSVETEVARFRYRKEQGVWELFCDDRSGRWRRPKGTRARSSVKPLLAELDARWI